MNPILDFRNLIQARDKFYYSSTGTDFSRNQICIDNKIQIDKKIENILILSLKCRLMPRMPNKMNRQTHSKDKRYYF